MSIVNSIPQLLAAGGDYLIQRSVRLRSSASAYFNRTFATPTNNKIWTWSGWIKRGALGGNQTIAQAGTSSTFVSCLYFDSLDRLAFQLYNSGYASGTYVNTPAVFRDPSAWYHVVFSYDSANAVAANRILIYVNGVSQTITINNQLPQNTVSIFNSAISHAISYSSVAAWGGTYIDGYLTEINFIDGQALNPLSFGQFNSLTGVWQPAKYTGTYGTNGFYLNFQDNSAATAAAIGKDSSGNGNNWTPNNISVTAGVTYDSMLDSPTLGASGTQPVGNYAVLNPLDNGGSSSGAVVLSNANLNFSASGGTAPLVRGTIGVSSGKWYWEITSLSGLNNIGVALNTAAIGTELGGAANGWSYLEDGRKYNAGSASAYGATYTANDVIGVALDMDAGTLTFYKNGTSQGQAFSGITGIAFPALSKRGASTATIAINHGQRPFSYTPPTGFQALCTTNIPDSTIVKGNKVMDATTYTGNGSTQTITNAGAFKPDLVWVKGRSVAYNNYLEDSVRGVGKDLSSNTTDAEATYNLLSSFNSNGFTVFTNGTYLASNQNGTTYVAWQWQAGQGTTSSNTSGSITSTVSVNPSAGFSIVTYTGNGSTGTIGHGLGVAPKFIITKYRNAVNAWLCYSASLGAGNRIYLNQTDAAGASATVWNNTSPTSSVFSVGDANTNASGGTYVAYCWSEVAGFSKFGSYTGNGSTDGPFVYTGFRPRFILYKRTDTSTYSWGMADTARATFNPLPTSANELRAESSGAESSGPNDIFDILSNGFKIRDTGAGINASGGTYIYAAFAEVSFKNALGR